MLPPAWFEREERSVMWTDEKIATAIKLIGSNAPYRDVAAAIGVTKNALIGKMHRQKIKAVIVRTPNKPYLWEFVTWQYKRDNPWR